MRIMICLGVLLGGTLGAHAQYMSYRDWEDLSRPSRGVYIAGLFDAYLTSTVQYGLGPIAKHYLECVQKRGMPNGQLADNIYAYSREHPTSQKAPLQDTMVAYLNELCGPPPKSQ